MHTVVSLWNSEEQLCQALSDDIQVCAEEAELGPINRYDYDIFHHERRKLCASICCPRSNRHIISLKHKRNTSEFQLHKLYRKANLPVKRGLVSGFLTLIFY